MGGEQGWVEEPWSDRGLDKEMGRALASPDFYCGQALLQSLGAQTSEDPQNINNKKPKKHIQ